MAFLETTNTILISALNFFRRRDKLMSHKKGQAVTNQNQHLQQKFPPIKIYLYGVDYYEVLQPKDFEELWQLLKAQQNQHKIWIDIEGRGDSAFIKAIGKHFGLHELEMEDVMNIYQRPKVEFYDQHLFVISRMIYYSKISKTLINEQVAFFVFDNLLVTFQEAHEDSFDEVREKMRKNHLMITGGNSFFLAWALMDAIIDQYFVILESLGLRLESVENELLNTPQKSHLLEIQSLKREIMFLRKAIHAERDKLAELGRHDFELIDDKTRIYLRDTYDHTAQIIDIIESQKEISYSLMEIYLSTQNNKMSEVMKVLTVISSIFIPLTFIVGIYGMNFSNKDENGNPLPYNMPELTSPHGYMIVMSLMLTIAIGQAIYFKRKKWL